MTSQRELDAVIGVISPHAQRSATQGIRKPASSPSEDDSPVLRNVSPPGHRSEGYAGRKGTPRFQRYNDQDKVGTTSRGAQREYAVDLLNVGAAWPDQDGGTPSGEYPVRDVSMPYWEGHVPWIEGSPNLHSKISTATQETRDSVIRHPASSGKDATRPDLHAHCQRGSLDAQSISSRENLTQLSDRASEWLPLPQSSSLSAHVQTGIRGNAKWFGQGSSGSVDESVTAGRGEVRNML